MVLQKYVVDSGKSIKTKIYVQSDSPLVTTTTSDVDDVEVGEWQSLRAEPFHLLMLYDASGTMTPTAAAMRVQAEALLNLLPIEAQVAIYRFNDQPELEYPFGPKESDRDELMSAIQNLQVENDATCMYDALSHMLTIADQIEPNAPRRAVILLSDGRDEKTRGEGDTCSVKSEQDILNQAANASPPIPIFVLGFEGNEPINEETLRNLAGVNNNNRFAVANGQVPLINGKSLFDNLINYFSQQWLLEVELFPNIGEHIIDISGQTAEGQVLRLSIPFTAVNDYTPAPPPPQEVPDVLEVTLDNFIYDPRDNQFEYSIRFSDVAVAQRAGDWQLQIADISLTGFDTHTISVTEQISDTETITRTQTITTVANPQISNIVLDLSEGTNRITGMVPLPEEAPGFMQPEHYYLAEVIPPMPSPQDKIEILAPIEPATWQAPAPIIDAKYRITGVRPPTLHITYTTEYEEYADKLVGYLWHESEVKSFTIPISTTATSDSRQYYAETELGGFKTYSLTTYFQQGDRSYLAKTAENVTINNELWMRLNLWLATHVRGDWIVPVLLVTVLMLLIGVYLLLSSRPPRPLPAPSPIPVSIASRQFAFRVINSPDAAHASHPILVDDDVFVIGREGCNLNLAGDRQVSRRHAMIEKKEDGIYITDLKSRNGTFLAGKRLSPHQRQRLEPNAEVQLGKNTYLRFV